MAEAQFLTEAELIFSMYYVYFAMSLKNDKVYVGFTSKHPKERIDDHNLGSNKWSRQNGELKLIYYETYYCKKDAIMREKFYKSGMGKRVKYAIISEFIEGR